MQLHEKRSAFQWKALKNTMLFSEKRYAFQQNFMRLWVITKYRSFVYLRKSKQYYCSFVLLCRFSIFICLPQTDVSAWTDKIGRNPWGTPINMTLFHLLVVPTCNSKESEQQWRIRKIVLGWWLGGGGEDSHSFSNMNCGSRKKYQKQRRCNRLEPGQA